ncbi:Gfo/Idh/MocA family oxidoreductase [Micromonospora sp. NBC_01655]|uniref:Gfo/Idh/MocA family protein n=1 Tax=Micromonospora sp. NBC_01655 TaxID=2975983 RepID=UPI00224EBF6D|nr:Gfo/Idh/MocA family oxidoreductase [Micromonospora sp. NBC_01655]MCX4469514.1 Gfo/Idh/MocA family oxidoreductase [Micromonospora sp. NBC_01655]
MEPLRIGVLGCADIARRRMLPAIARVPDTEVVAVASRDPERAARTAREFDCRPVTGYPELLARPDVDAVYVPLPAALHAEWVEAALRAGKHVLAEKPVTTDPDRTAALVELARSRELILMENVMFVHHAQHAVVARLLREGVIGELRAFEATFTIPALPDDDIRYRPELGGGALSDVGVYPVRAALHVLGPELAVVGAVLTTGAERLVDTSGAALLRTPDGVTASLLFGLEHAYRSRYELIGATGRIVLDRAFTPPADHHPVVRVERFDGVREIRLEPDDQVRNTVAAFASAVRAGAGSGDPAGVGDSLRLARLLHDVRERAASLLTRSRRSSPSCSGA